LSSFFISSSFFSESWNVDGSMFGKSYERSSSERSSERVREGVERSDAIESGAT